MTDIRKLRSDEIEVRVAQVGPNGAALLLYKTARVDRAILTEAFGNLWQNDFKVIDGKMYGGIGIFNESLNQWLWRWDCGTESNTEAEKGQASDCFKRAGFKWGIGVELYSAPFIWVKVETIQDGKRWQLKDRYMKFEVQHIAYTGNEISELVIQDTRGGIWFTMKKNGSNHSTKPAKQQNETVQPEKTLKNRYEDWIKFLSAKPDKSLNLADEKTATIIMRVQDVLNELQTAGRAKEYKQLNDLTNAKLIKAA